MICLHPRDQGFLRLPGGQVSGHDKDRSRDFLPGMEFPMGILKYAQDFHPGPVLRIIVPAEQLPVLLAQDQIQVALSDGLPFRLQNSRKG